MSLGKTMLGRRHVLPSVVSSLVELQVEGTFTSGTYLVTVHNPISSDDGNLERALYGSFLPIPSQDKFELPPPTEYEPQKQPGAIIPVKGGRIVLNKDRRRIRLRVVSKGDRPIQVSFPSVIENVWQVVVLRLLPRSVRITILLRQIHNSTLIASRLEAFV